MSTNIFQKYYFIFQLFQIPHIHADINLCHVGVNSMNHHWKREAGLHWVFGQGMVSSQMTGYSSSAQTTWTTTQYKKIIRLNNLFERTFLWMEFVEFYT